jgi:ankyrin repeat protein
MPPYAVTMVLQGKTTPLQYAALFLRTEIVSLLLEKGADIEAKDKVILIDTM